ncbi:MAG: hypothetical protein SNJ78_06520 [Spirochaetales bacterium]
MIPLGLEARRQLVRDFVSYHLGRLRGGSAPVLANKDDEIPYSSPPLLADSLETVYLAGIFADTYGFRKLGLEDLLLAKPSIAQYADLLSRIWESVDTVGFFTSGSQGKPQLIYHPWDRLWEEVKTFSPLLEQQLGWPPQRVVSLVPSIHIYGFLWSLVYPWFRGIPFMRQSPVSTQFQDQDLVISTPHLIKQWNLRGVCLPKRIGILLSTAPLEASEARFLDAQGIRWVELYGSTETGGIGYRTTLSTGFIPLPGWKLELLAEGTLKLYKGEESFLGPDFVLLDGPYILPQGRRDQAVQIAGVNVYPQKIKVFLEQQEGIAQAAVRPYTSEMGLRLKAFIVPRTGEEPKALEERLRLACSKHLTPPERPQLFTFGPELPKNEMGKLTDWE